MPLGSLCVWGDWFGKPLDNQHILVAAVEDGDMLVLTFDEDEVLTVRGPRDWVVDPHGPPGSPVLRIEGADQVEWEWYPYGHAKLAESRRREVHWLEGGRVRALAEPGPFASVLAPTLEKPAVIFL
jgi:hypothetical protein